MGDGEGVMDRRDECRWYGGDCGSGEKCCDECFEPFEDELIDERLNNPDPDEWLKRFYRR